jgi:hypothetical protein
LHKEQKIYTIEDVRAVDPKNAAEIEASIYPNQRDKMIESSRELAMSSFVVGWKMGRNSMIDALNEIGGAEHPDAIIVLINRAFARDSILYSLSLMEVK